MIRKIFSTDISGGGIPCKWEEGGAGNSGMYSLVITDMTGRRPAAICIPRMQQPCGQHALIPIKPGYFIIEVGSEHITQIWRILTMSEAHFEAELVQEYVAGRWSSFYAPLQESTSINLNEAIDAAWRKADDYGCVREYWAIKPRSYTIPGTKESVS